MDYKKSSAPKGGRNAPRHSEKGAKGTSANPFGPPKKAHDSDEPRGKSALDKPSTGEGEMAIDQDGKKGIRGLEGPAKDEHEAERKKAAPRKS